MSPATSRSSTPDKWSMGTRSNLGIDPKSLVGKVLTRAKRSSVHPSLTLEFEDHTSFQLRVDGYDPRHKGLPKDLLINDTLANSELPTRSVLDCVLISLSDKAFHRDPTFGGHEEWWDQEHTVLALKFSESEPAWHTVCARLQDSDPTGRNCTFRSYADVYLEQVHRSPRKKRRTSYL